MGTASPSFSEKNIPLERLDAQQNVVERLEHFSIYSDRLVVLSGASGSGRTTLLSILKSQLPEAIDVRLVCCRDKDWLSKCLNEQGVESTAAKHSFQFGLSQLNPSKDTLFLFDNADELTIEQVERLIEKVKHEYFHCAIAVNTDSRLSQWCSEYSDRLIFLPLPLLDNDDSIKLLAHTLLVTEKQLLLLISDKELNKTLEESEGNPGKLISASKKITEVCEQQETETLKPAMPYHRIWLAAAYLAVGVIFILIFIFQDSINDSVFTSKTNEPNLSKESNQNQDPLDSTEMSNESVAGTKIYRSDTLEKKEQQEQVTLSNARKSTENKQKVLQKSDGDKALETAQTEKTNVEVVSNRLDESKRKNATLTKSDEAKARNSEVKSVTEESKNSELVEQTEKGSKNGAQLTSKVTQSDVTSQKVQDTAEKVSNPIINNESLESATKKKENKNIKLKPFYNAEEVYLLGLPDTQWVIQLGGFSSLENTSSFLKQHRNTGELHFYQTTRNNKPWFVVIMGPYESKELADTTRSKLPVSLSSRNPWLKSIQTTQSEIQRKSPR